MSDCCPELEKDQIQRRITEVKSLLAKLSSGVLPGGNNAPEFGNTTCWPGGFPTWTLKVPKTRGKCVKECVDEHEAVHGYQCTQLGMIDYYSLSKKEEIACEILGYQAELSCLERKLEACK